MDIQRVSKELKWQCIAMFSGVLPTSMASYMHALLLASLKTWLEPKGECWEGDSATGLLLHRLQLREGGVVNQLQQMTIQSHLSGKERERRLALQTQFCLAAFLRLMKALKNQ